VYYVSFLEKISFISENAPYNAIIAKSTIAIKVMAKVDSVRIPLSCGDFPRVHANKNLGISS